MFLDDAELKTESWRLRHSPEAIRTLGVWRWKGMQRHMDRILGLCAGKRVIDFGGADGPLGLGAIIVDNKYDTFLDDQLPADVLFTSHTLEHCTDLTGILRDIADKVLPGGYLIAHVPAWTCKRWRAGEYSNDRQTDHRHTFALAGDNDRFSYSGEFIDVHFLDTLMAKHFDIQLAEHCGDNSIMVIGRKR